MAHCLKGFLQRLFQFPNPENTVSFEESISLQENNPSEIDDARCDWTTTDEESGEASDEESDEESDDRSVNSDEGDAVQVGYADRPRDTNDRATMTSTSNKNDRTKSRNNLNALGWPKNARIDPWMAAVWQNAVRSPLCGLPDPILLNIMQRLDLTAICQLRRASREFLRLFSSHEFKKWRYKGSDYKFLWASPVQAPGSVDALKFGAPKDQAREPWLWYPEKGPRRLDPMGCFDPNLCLCLHYEGRGIFEPLLHPKAPKAPNWLTDCPRSPGQVLTMSNAYLNPDGHENYKWAKNAKSYLQSEFRRCGKHKKCLILELTRCFSTTDDRGRPLTPSSPGWYLALDPASHNLTEDDEFKEVTWCEDQACRNYYRLRENANLGRA
ncbi:F-box domain containing protein [Colletotrichum asianum]